MLRRWLPSSHHSANHKSLKWLGPLVKDPYLFHLNRHSVSVAFFVGVFSAFLPLPGQTLIAAGLALVFRCNLPISVLLIWITNPFTIPPIFYLTYELGRWILSSPPIDFAVQLSWEWFNQQGQHILWPLLLGSVISGLFFGVLAYLSVQWFWRWSVVSHWQARGRRRKAQKP